MVKAGASMTGIGRDAVGNLGKMPEKESKDLALGLHSLIT